MDSWYDSVNAFVTSDTPRHSVAAFGEWLAEKLEAEGMTAAELSRKLGVTSTAVYSWLNGLSRPRDPTAKRLARVFHVDVAAVHAAMGRIKPESQPSRDQLTEELLDLFDELSLEDRRLALRLVRELRAHQEEIEGD